MGVFCSNNIKLDLKFCMELKLKIWIFDKCAGFFIKNIQASEAPIVQDHLNCRESIKMKSLNRIESIKCCIEKVFEPFCPMTSILVTDNEDKMCW